MAVRVVRVWDVGVRAFHWGLVAAVAGVALTGFIIGRTALAWHLTVGAVVAAALFWRFVWGLLGPTYARFAGFTPPPSRVLAYLRGRPHQRHVGHNPLGALMVLALLVVLGVLVFTGTMTLGGLHKQGPARGFLSYAAGRQFFGVHSLLARVLLGMIGAHLAGVAVESWRERENLVRAMLTGDKPALPPFVPVPPATARPRLAVGLTLGVVVVAAVALLALSALPARGVPPPGQDAMVAVQCGACHLAYPASLAPASTWNAILDDLPHHFGDDASLSPAQVAQIRAWFDANSAGHWDTQASHLFRQPAADGSLRITDTAGWQRMHRSIAPAVFAGKDGTRRSDCAACHADAATGLFAPQKIDIADGAGG